MVFVLQVIGHKISLSRGLSRPSDGHSWSHTANLAKKPITSSINIEQHSLESISQSRWSDTLPATPDLLFQLNATFWDIQTKTNTLTMSWLQECTVEVSLKSVNLYFTLSFFDKLSNHFWTFEAGRGLCMQSAARTKVKRAKNKAQLETMDSLINCWLMPKSLSKFGNN